MSGVHISLCGHDLTSAPILSLMVFEKWLLDCAYILPSSAEKALERVQAADTK